MGDVVEFSGLEVIGEGATVDPDQVLEAAKGQFGTVVVIGIDEAGAVALCSSHDSRETLWLIEKAKHHLLFEVEA